MAADWRAAGGRLGRAEGGRARARPCVLGLSNDVQGADGNSGVEEWGSWDCYLTDAEDTTGSFNERQDVGGGFGLLNARSGYNDGTPVCRVMIED